MNCNILLFFDIGGGEIFLILLIILLFFGSKKIPDLARGLGKGIREFKNAAGDVQREIQKNVTEVKKETDITKD
jgi:sec-independent protein translocase protein TatA